MVVLNGKAAVLSLFRLLQVDPQLPADTSAYNDIARLHVFPKRIQDFSIKVRCDGSKTLYSSMCAIYKCSVRVCRHLHELYHKNIQKGCIACVKKQKNNNKSACFWFYSSSRTVYKSSGNCHSPARAAGGGAAVHSMWQHRRRCGKHTQICAHLI